MCRFCDLLKHGGKMYWSERSALAGGSIYGFNHLEDIMRSMYNQTM